MSFPRLPGQFSKKAFIEPAAFIDYVAKRGRLPKYKVPENIIFFFLPTQLPKLPALENAETKKFFNARMDLLCKGQVGLVSQFGFGAPALTIQLELLIALGAKKFIGVGTSGSLIGDVEIGDLILCTKAVRDEGVSYHYVPPAEFSYPSESLNRALKATAKSKKIVLKEAPTWTTDAIYRETVEEVQHFRKMGVHTVDMEASALFAVAHYRKVQAASLFAISDLLTGDEWSPHLHTTAAPLENLLGLAIGVLG